MLSSTTTASILLSSAGIFAQSISLDRRCIRGYTANSSLNVSAEGRKEINYTVSKPLKGNTVTVIDVLAVQQVVQDLDRVFAH